MKKLGFFGGCFNPVTLAHLNLIKEAIQQENLEKVYFVPMGDFYEKNGLISLEHRMNMLTLAFANEPQIDILMISNQEKKMYAIDTFQVIEAMFPEAERFFIIGSDNYQKMTTWKEAKSLLKNYQYIILDRKNPETKQISSSRVREKIKQGEKITDLVPKPVAEYIEQKNLYK